MRKNLLLKIRLSCKSFWIQIVWIHCEKSFIAILKTIGPHVKIYLADFLKTNLAKFAAWLKKGQKAGFLRPISSKITLAKEKERRIKLRGREEEESRRRETSNGCTLGFIRSTVETEKKKNCLTEEGVYLAQTFSNIKYQIYGYLVFQLLKSTR